MNVGYIGRQEVYLRPKSEQFTRWGHQYFLETEYSVSPYHLFAVHVPDKWWQTGLVLWVDLKPIDFRRKGGLWFVNSNGFKYFCLPFGGRLKLQVTASTRTANIGKFTMVRFRLDFVFYVTVPTFLFNLSKNGKCQCVLFFFGWLDRNIPSPVLISSRSFSQGINNDCFFCFFRRGLSYVPRSKLQEKTRG